MLPVGNYTSKWAWTPKMLLYWSRLFPWQIPSSRSWGIPDKTFYMGRFNTSWQHGRHLWLEDLAGSTFFSHRLPGNTFFSHHLAGNTFYSHKLAGCTFFSHKPSWLGGPQSICTSHLVLFMMIDLKNIVKFWELFGINRGGQHGPVVKVDSTHASVLSSIPTVCREQR